MNTTTGEFVTLSDRVLIEVDEELAEEIDFSGDYVRLPNRYDIHEYNIMENFAGMVKDARKREKLFQAWRGIGEMKKTKPPVLWE